MSEPPELDDEPDDPAAGADLEELLEQIREPEEPLGQRANPLWLVSAILLSVLACWLALRASGGGVEEKPKSVALAGAMLPGKTSERLPRDEETEDVVEDYLARCKKGMTALEVRWIVEDFQRAGLDKEPSSGDSIEQLVSRRLAQHEWYIELLVNGLNLNSDQRHVASLKLESLHSDAVAGLTRDLDENEGHRTWGILKPFVDTVDWLVEDQYAPWNLCSLTPEQEAVTRRSEVEEERLQQEEAEANHENSSATMRLDQGTPFRSSLTSKREIHLADGDFGELAAAGHVFPLEETQLFEGEEFLRINDPTRLHPAQLKMLLLLEPGRAAQILQALEKANE